MKLHNLLGATALVGTLLLPSAAIAQATPTTTNPAALAPQNAQEAEADAEMAASADGDGSSTGDVIVTGSRIPRPETDGVLPGVSVGQQQITTRGFTNAIDIVNDIPLTGSGASLSGTNGLGQPTALGLAFIDLLDLGTTRTLTLVNGRRFVSGNTATLFAFGNETGGQVDVNNIPTQLIERVDVVTVGGAAAYGTDAIAGVVNFVLRDSYQGLDVSAVSNVTDRGDGFGYNLRAIAGTNFAGDRGNIVINGEYSRVDAVYAGRDYTYSQAANVPSPFNGGIRNPNFTAQIGGTTSPFLPAGSDGAPGNLASDFTRSIGLSFGGSIFETLSTLPAQNRPAASPGSQTFVSPTSQIVPGTVVSAAQAGCSAANPRFCNFAPSGLIGSSDTDATRIAFAQSVLAQLSPANVAAGTQAQRNALALSLLQANRATPREFFAANPTVPTGAFAGQFIPGFVDVANPNTTLVTVAGQQVPLNQILPRVAVPLQFDNGGNVIAIDPGTLTPTQPATVGQSTSRQGFFDPRVTIGTYTNLLVRPQQDRYLANLIGKFEVTPGLTFFTENLYAKNRAVLPRNQATANSVLGTAPETAALILNVNNPYLDDADRAALATYGITAANRNGNFSLSRVNQDILGDNPTVNETETYRLVGGFRGDFGLFGKRHRWELSATYGRVNLRQTARSLRDVEFSLAVDTVRDASGNIRCRSQVDATAANNLTGVQPNIIRVIGADGLPTEQIFTPTANAALIQACQPLNPFGINNMSQAAKDYVTAFQITDNKAEQLFFQGQLSGGLFDLPGGGLDYALTAEYRREDLSIINDELQQAGRTRSAPYSPTQGRLNTYEGGAELRIPIFGDDFTLPLFQGLEFNPSVRFTKQTGNAPSFRNLAGNVINPEYRGDWETIYSLAGTWRPIRDVSFRGNYTRSLRQPNIVELFLTNQPAFAATLDPCSNQRISLAADPARRTENCAALVVASGVRGNLADARTFLSTFRSTDISQPVAFAGNSGLRPEEGESYTFGGILTPRFLPRFTLSADYINLKLNNQIIPTNPTQAAGFCVDSPTFPDTTAQFGSNLCGFIPRGADFQVLPGAAGQYLNLSATRVEGINISGLFTFDLPRDTGSLTLRSNAFHLIRYDTSATGQFNDTQKSAGSFARPKWEAVSSVRYENSGFFTQLTHRWQTPTTIFSGGVPATIELQNFIRYPAQNLFDVAVGGELENGFRMQLVVTNLTDKLTAGSTGLYQQAYFDTLGRRYQVTVGKKF